MGQKAWRLDRIGLIDKEFSDMKYSVIIPIYNSECTLRRCLDSLLPQLNNDIEVLLINDGSTDSCGDICKEYVTKNPCYVYFEQQNSGVSVARNKGLDNAKGEYILFVDSDDYVEHEYFNTIDECISKEKPDLILFGAVFEKRKNNAKVAYNENKSYIGIDCTKQIVALTKKQEMYSLWNKVFVKRIIDEKRIRFNQNLNLGEDGSFIFEYTLYTQKLTTCNAVLYHVDESNQDSLSRKRREDLSKDLIASAKQRESALSGSFLDKKKLRLFQKSLSRGYYRGAYSCFLEISRHSFSESEMNKKISEICFDYRKNKIKPVGFESKLIAIPVLWNLTSLIKMMLRLKK